MTVFRFRLEKLLELRLAEEESVARSVASARESVRKAEEQLRQSAEAEADVRSKISAVLNDDASVGTLQQLRVLHGHLQRQRHAAQGDMNQAQAALEEQLEAFREAIKEREVLDKLKERQKDLWRIEQRRLEQNDLDEQSRNGGGATLSGGSSILTGNEERR